MAREENATMSESDESRSWRRRRRGCCRCRCRNRSRSRSRSRISRQYAYRQLPHTKHIDKHTHTEAHRLCTHTYTQPVRMEKAFLHFFTVFFCFLLLFLVSFISIIYMCTLYMHIHYIYTILHILYVRFINVIYNYYISAIKTSSQLELDNFCCKFL